MNIGFNALKNMNVSQVLELEESINTRQNKNTQNSSLPKAFLSKTGGTGSGEISFKFNYHSKEKPFAEQLVEDLE